MTNKVLVGSLEHECPYCGAKNLVPVYAWSDRSKDGVTMNVVTSADTSSAWFHYLEHSYEGDLDD